MIVVKYQVVKEMILIFAELIRQAHRIIFDCGFSNIIVAKILFYEIIVETNQLIDYRCFILLLSFFYNYSTRFMLGTSQCIMSHAAK